MKKPWAGKPHFHILWQNKTRPNSDYQFQSLKQAYKEESGETRWIESINIKFPNATARYLSIPPPPPQANPLTRLRKVHENRNPPPTRSELPCNAASPTQKILSNSSRRDRTRAEAESRVTTTYFIVRESDRSGWSFGAGSWNHTERHY